MPRVANGVNNQCKLEDISDQMSFYEPASTGELLKGAGLSKQEKTKSNKHRHDIAGYSIQVPTEENIQCSHSVNSDEANSGDEVKVFNEEGAPEEELRNSESLSEEKTEIIKENSQVRNRIFSRNCNKIFP